jgi:hypothetical protein
MLPIMLLVGFVLQRPLDRAMKRLQAESAARHGVLVESLSGLETVRATGAEARMQTAWERSVAATARSGEDVHFWASLSLTSANVAQQITNISPGHRCLSHPRRQATVGAGSGGCWRAVCSRPLQDYLGDYPGARPVIGSNRSTASCRWSASDTAAGFTFPGRSREDGLLRMSALPIQVPGNALERSRSQHRRR